MRYIVAVPRCMQYDHRSIIARSAAQSVLLQDARRRQRTAGSATE